MPPPIRPPPELPPINPPPPLAPRNESTPEPPAAPVRLTELVAEDGCAGGLLQAERMTELDFTTSEIVYANLGNLTTGCQMYGQGVVANLTDGCPDGIRLRHVADNVDLLVTNLTEYQPWNTRANMLHSGGILQINLMTPHPEEVGVQQRDVELELAFVQSDTLLPAVLSNFQITFLDLDQGDGAGNGRECISVPSAEVESGLYEIAFVAEPAQAGVVLDADPQRRGWLRACSKYAGLGSDNPSNPLRMSDEQRAKSVALSYRGVSRVRTALSIGRSGYGGRNFLLAGSSNTLPHCHTATLPLVGMGAASALTSEADASLVVDGATITTAVVVTMVAPMVVEGLSALAGAAGGSAFGPAFGGGANLMALVYGGQRFVAYGNLDVNDVHDETAESLAWLQGNVDTGFSLAGDVERCDASFPEGECSWNWCTWSRLNTTGDDCTQHGRRLASSGGSSVVVVVNLLFILAIVLASLCLCQATAYYMWTRRVNQKYYERKANPKKALAKAIAEIEGQERSSRSKRGSGQSKRGSNKSVEDGDGRAMTHKVAREIAMRRLRFKPYPSPLVFPGLQWLAISLFCTGLMGNGVRALVRFDHPSELGWRIMAVTVVSAVTFYKLCTLAMLVRFHRRFRAATWRAAKYPEDAEKVVDPLYRLVSRVRFQSCPHWHKPLVIDRPQGMFARPAGETKEPERTERILARPTRIVHGNAADTIDTIGFPLMARAGGANLWWVLFEWIALGANVAIAGICATVRPGDGDATLQLAQILTIQCVVAFYTFFVRPSADRVMNLLVGTQFTLEAIMSVLLLIAEKNDNVSNSRLMAFWLALSAMLAPVAQRFYDAVIVQYSKWVRKNGFSWKGAFFAFIGLLVFIPSMVARLLGCETGYQGSLSKAAGDDINKMATKTANEGVIRELEEGLAEVASNLFWLTSVEAEDRRKKRDEKVRQAARAIQENWRRKKMAQRAEIAATARRARIERRRESRRASSRPRDIASAGTPASANFTGQERPGAEWLERNVQEVLVSEQEAADNERPGLDWLARVMNEAMSQDEDDRDLLR